MPATSALADATLDLVLGSACVGCTAPGRVLCPCCRTGLPRSGQVAWPSPTPAGLAPPFAAGAYEGLLRVLVIQHKEHAVLALADPLGQVLGDVVHDLVGRARPPGRAGGRVLLVPVPSRRRVVRARGHDPLLRVARVAARRLRRRGVETTVRQLLRPVGRVRDQSTLGAEERAANLAGTMRTRRTARVRGDLVVLVDDVLTTGSTAREAQRALERAGVPVHGIAVVAATRRRHPPGSSGLSNRGPDG